MFALPYWQKLQQDLNELHQQIDQAATAQSELQAKLTGALELTRQHQEVMDQQGEIAQKQLQFMNEQQSAFKQQDQRIADAEQQMLQKELALDHTIQDVRKLAGKPDNRWMVAEAEYLIQVAMARLNLAYDAKTAATALKQADERLLATGETRWEKVHEQLARDIDTLKEVTLPPIAPLSRQLDELIAKIPTLKLASVHQEASTKQASNGEKPVAEPSWDNLLDSFMEGAKNTVRIRRTDQPVQPLIAPQQTLLLYQNLELMLGSARLALLQREDALFKESLQRADQWLEGQFDNEDAVTQSMRETLGRMSGLTLLPPLPDISRSLEYLNTENARDRVAP